MKSKYDIEDRLIRFSSNVIDFVEGLPQNMLSRHLGNQLMRSSTSPALNYGEAQAAESSKDFIHKMKICLKELRESSVAMKILKTRSYVDHSRVDELTKECNELTSIFYTSIKTAQNNMRK